MPVCGRCGRAFTPGDEIDLAGVKLPPFAFALVKPHLSRLTLHSCSAPECGGLVTGLYLPPQPRPTAKT